MTVVYVLALHLQSQLSKQGTQTVIHPVAAILEVPRREDRVNMGLLCC